METLRDLGYEGKKAATGNIGKLAVGTLADGQGVVVAKTASTEGYTLYHNYYDALTIFDEIVHKAGLTIIY